MFRILPLSIIRSFSQYIQQWYMSYRFADSLWAGSGWNCVPSSQAVSKYVWHKPLLCVQRKSPDDGQRNCPKHVEFYSKNKFEKLVHLVGFIIRIYHDARSPERQIYLSYFIRCRRFAACKRSLNLRGSRNLGKITTGHLSSPQFHFRC